MTTIVESGIFVPRHIDRLSRPLVRLLAVFVLVMHGVLAVLLLRNIPVAELGSGGGSTLYISILQGPSAGQGKAVPGAGSQPAVVPKAQKHFPMKEKESGLITTAAVSDHAAQAVTSVQNKKPEADNPVAGKNQGAGSDTGMAAGRDAGKRSGNVESSGTEGSPGPGGAGGDSVRSVALSRLSYKRAFKPEYPERSIQRNETGQVRVRVVVGTDGRVHDAQVISSSGFKRLDEAALKAARRSTFHPYSENGLALAAMAVVPYEFNLKAASWPVTQQTEENHGTR